MAKHISATRYWMSDNGFQQLTLVCDSRPMRFKSSDRSMRRALCKDENGAFILESNYPMTLTTFAYYCSKQCSNATYLDMGEYGFGYIKRGWFIRPLHIWGIFSRHKQIGFISSKPTTICKIDILAINIVCIDLKKMRA